MPQYTVEKVLHERITRLPSVRILSGTVLEDFVQSASGVSANVRELTSDIERTIRAAYLVGADGARSRVRAIIGAKMSGEHAMAQQLQLIVRIRELAENPPSHRAIMYWVVNPQSPCVLSPLDGTDIWAFGMSLPPGVEGDFRRRRSNRRVHAAIGRPVDIEILERESGRHIG